jgi:hypothetical protein
MPDNAHGIPDSPMDVEFYCRESWHKLFPTSWADICKTKPEVAAMHARHVSAMIKVNCNFHHSIAVVTNGRISWKALDETDKEHQVQMAGVLRTIFNERMKQ